MQQTMPCSPRSPGCGHPTLTAGERTSPHLSSPHGSRCLKPGQRLGEQLSDAENQRHQTSM